MNSGQWVVGALLAAAAAVAQAQQGVTASVGTTGFGMHLSHALQPNLNARVGLNFFSFDRSDRTDTVSYDVNLRLRSVDALLDFFPLHSGLRVSAGVIYNANRFKATGRPDPDGEFTFNGRTYQAAVVGALEGTVDFRRFSPYLGIGWGNAASRPAGWSVAGDIGVKFQGEPRSTLVNRGCTGTPEVCAQIAADVAAENQQLREELRGFRFFPVVRIGVTYRF